jgi:hypothetical protein
MDQKVKLLFIIPAHECNDCLEDTIQNIIKFNKDIEPLFAIHVNNGFNDFDEQRFTKTNITFMYCQDKMAGVKYESQLSPILRTYKLAKSKFGEDIEYVKIFHTSELFVRHGFYDYIKNYDTSFDPRTDALPERYYPIFQLGVFERTEHIFYQGVELGFFSKKIMEHIEHFCYKEMPISCEQLNYYFNYTPIEEVVMPTIAMRYAKNVGRNVNVMKDDIENINLEGSLFTLKSVPRDINHPVRVKVREL